MDEIKLLKKLSEPDGKKKLHIVLDTDTKNEIDDQFALTYAFRCHQKGKISLDAVYAAPFTHSPSPSAGEGMEQSYEEIIKILNMLGKKDTDGYVFRGSDKFMNDSPVISPAANDLVERALKFPEDEPLYVVAIGAITNVASAILINPEIINHIVLVWLGGTEIHQNFANEYNLEQDTRASRIILDSGVPLVQLPCRGVVDGFRTSVSELERYIDGKSEIGTYLTQNVRECDFSHANTRVIWDVTAVGYLVHSEWYDTALYHTPHLSEEPEIPVAFKCLDCYKESGGRLYWSHDTNRHFMRAVTHFNRDKLFFDLFENING